MPPAFFLILLFVSIAVGAVVGAVLGLFVADLIIKLFSRE